MDSNTEPIDIFEFDHSYVFIIYVLISFSVVNNAAIVNEKSKFWEIPPHEFDSVIDTNIKGTANVLRHFIPHMIAREKKIIVNMSSLWGRIGAPMVHTYSTHIW